MTHGQNMVMARGDLKAMLRDELMNAARGASNGDLARSDLKALLTHELMAARGVPDKTPPELRALAREIQMARAGDMDFRSALTGVMPAEARELEKSERAAEWWCYMFWGIWWPSLGCHDNMV